MFSIKRGSPYLQVRVVHRFTVYVKKKSIYSEAHSFAVDAYIRQLQSTKVRRGIGPF